MLEIKSTYLRQSQRDAWVHGTSTLRRAGRQIGRKLAAVRLALEVDASLVEALGVPSHEATIDVHGWIEKGAGRQAQAAQTCESLYPGGFTAAKFIEVIEQELVWAAG